MSISFLEISQNIKRIVDKYNSYNLPQPITSLDSTNSFDFGSSAMGYDLKIYIDNLVKSGNMSHIGIAGLPGIQGVQGPRGDIGEMGDMGPVGDKGPVGPPGVPGSNGSSGSNGGNAGTTNPPNIINYFYGNTSFPLSFFKFNIRTEVGMVKYNVWHTLFGFSNLKFGMVQLHLNLPWYNSETQSLNNVYHNYMDVVTVVKIYPNSIRYLPLQVGSRSYAVIQQANMTVNVLGICT